MKIIMERIFKINGQVISIDKWCNNNITEDTDLVTALRQCISENPELEAFKPQVRACIRNWQEDKRLLGDVEIVKVDMDSCNDESCCDE